MSQDNNTPAGELPLRPAGSNAREDVTPETTAPAAGVGRSSAAPGGHAPANQEDKTVALPPRLRPRQPKPRTPPSPWGVAGLVVLVILALIVPVLAYARLGVNGVTSTPAANVSVTCTDQNSPCEAAKLYLAAYAASNFEAMYGYVSAASQARFADPSIRGTIYATAHDYIVKRTASLLRQAQVYAIQTSQGTVQPHGAATATVPVHVVMQTIRVGAIAQDITLPLVLEKGVWRVSWSPGLVFKQLDDSADPQYQRLVRLTPLEAARGRILAADGTVLALDQTVYSIDLNPAKVAPTAAAQIDQTLANDLDSTPDKIKASYQGATQLVHLLTITQATYTKVSADLNALRSSGVLQVSQTTGRVYPFGADAAAVTGYVNAVGDSDLLNDPDHYYEATDLKGRDGVEGWAETSLRPVKGGELDIVDSASGQPVYTLARRSAEAGADVHTSINIKLQEAAVAQLRTEAHAGTAASIDPANGAVLVLASYPMYNPNDFSLGFSDNESVRFNALLPQSPYLNRAVAGQYAVGSVMKVTTLAAGLENSIAADQAFDCTGSFQIPGQSQPAIDDQVGGHGNINPVIALYESCDVVFWSIGVTLNSKDPNILPTMAKAFGYGSLTHLVGLANGVEQPGLVPDPAWLKQFNGGTWAPVDAANLAIGQGSFTATPLQIAVAAGAVANGGTRWQPRLVTAVVGPDGKTISAYAPAALGKLPVSADHLAVIQTAMVDVTSHPGATSVGSWINFPALVAAKTGTAQTCQPPCTSLPDALFMSYAPASPLSGATLQARIATGVVVEFSGTGDMFAAPVTRAIYTALLVPTGS